MSCRNVAFASRQRPAKHASYAYLRRDSFLSQELLDKVLLGKYSAQDRGKCHPLLQ